MFLKILAVDDSGLARKALVRLLAESFDGSEVFQAADGISALEEFDRVCPELVFLDLTMPGMRGQEVLAEIKKRSPDTPVIILSADIQKKTKEMVMELGASTMINKPIDKDKLFSAMQEIDY